MQRTPLQILFLLISATISLAANPPQPYLELGPMMGHTSSTSARFWAKASAPALISVVVSERPDLTRGKRFDGPILDKDSGLMGHVIADRLRPATQYYYCILFNNRRVSKRPYPSFTTAPPEGERGQVRFAFISCLGKNGFNAAACWGDMIRTSFDMVLFLGDNHYADSAEPAKQRAAYADHRRMAGFRDVSSRTPMYAIWDDHDFGPNNSDGTLKGKERSLKTFREHWVNPSYGEPDNMGIYYKFSRGAVDFFMLDDRFYRTPNKKVDDPNRTMLGERQMKWLKRELLASRAPVKVIASGSEWQSHSTEDCWSNFKAERDKLFRFLEENNIRGVLLISGDRHFTAAYQVAGKFIEVTSGPFGSSNAKIKPLPEMFLYQGEGRLYSIFDIDTRMDEPKVTLEVYRAGDGLVKKRPLTWSEITGQTQIEPLPQPKK